MNNKEKQLREALKETTALMVMLAGYAYEVRHDLMLGKPAKFMRLDDIDEARIQCRLNSKLLNEELPSPLTDKGEGSVVVYPITTTELHPQPDEFWSIAGGEIKQVQQVRSGEVKFTDGTIRNIAALREKVDAGFVKAEAL